MKSSYTLLIGLTMVVLSGCQPDPNTGEGFSLPKGDAAAGKIAFVDLACNACHSIADIEQLPSNDTALPHIKLGGTVRNVKAYGGLVTSIINPSHKVITTFTSHSSEQVVTPSTTHPSRIVMKRKDQEVIKSEDGSSKMRSYNDIMTVTQLVDLVTFLENNYEIDAYNRTTYRRFKTED